MMIVENTLCQDRPVRVDSFDVVTAPWGSGVICCEACASVMLTRNSWWEVYA